MFKIKMLSDAVGCADGINQKRYEKGSVYVINESLYTSFKNMGWCELVVEKQAKNPVKETTSKKINYETKTSVEQSDKQKTPLKIGEIKVDGQN